MAITADGANFVLDQYLERNLWVGLSDGDPAGAGTELTGNGYARVAVTAATWDAAATSSKDNGAAITFPEATGNWSEASYAGIWSAATEGTLYQSIALDAPVTITTGQVARFSAAALAITAA